MSEVLASRTRTPRIVQDMWRILRLRAEHLDCPLGIDAPRPRLSWLLRADERGKRQSAYRIEVASSPGLLQDGIADRWDSGTVASGVTQALYAGAALRSGERCWWRVQAWDETGQPTAWSEPAWFEMGLLHERAWVGGWIGDARVGERLHTEGAPYADRVDLPAPLLRRVFPVERALASARLYISGLGWHEAWINGRRVGDTVLEPLTTDYHRRVLYATHDVGALLVPGANAIGVMLGNGWYCPAYGDAPRLRCQLVLRYADGTETVVASDGAWRSGDGPILANGIHVGEAYDARREVGGWTTAGFDDATWRRAVAKEAPGGVMQAQPFGIRVRENLAPRSITPHPGGIQVLDFGVLFAGWARLRLRGRRGTCVTITYAPRLQPDGRAKALPHGRARDTYILRGDPAGETWEPRFTFHPVRWVQVEGTIDALGPADAQGVMAYHDVELPRGFACANDRLNRIHACVRQTLTNELYGIQMDCINAEHWGWLEPGSNPGTLYPRAWMPAFWDKFLADVRAAQREDGVIPDVVPAYPIKRRATGDPCWVGNFPLMTWYVYRVCGDRAVLAQNYAAMARWVDHLTAIAKDGILTEGYYGDHMVPGDAPGAEEWISTETPPPLLRTAFYYSNARTLALAAEVLGKAEDATRYAALAARIQAAYHATWYDPAGGRYATGSQTANLASVAFGLTPAADAGAVIADVVRDIARRGGRFRTGNIGTTAMMETLVAHGHGDLLYALVDRDTYPGWGYMVAQGATTIWEGWNGASIDEDDRESMAMFTTIDQFLWNDLVGIRAPGYFGVSPGGAAFDAIVIQPFLPATLAWAGGAHPTPHGEVSVRWDRTPDGLTLAVDIPVNATGTIHVPTLGCARPLLREGGTVVWDDAYRPGVPGITDARVSDQAIVVSVGSGHYRFTLTVR